MVEGLQQGPVLIGTFFMVAEEYLPPTAAPGREVGRYLRELGMPPLTLQEEGLTKGTPWGLGPS